VFLEEALGGGPLGIADHGHRPIGHINHDQRRDGRIIIGKFAFRDTVLRIDHPVGARNLDSEIFGGGPLRAL